MVDEISEYRASLGLSDEEFDRVFEAMYHEDADSDDEDEDEDAVNGPKKKIAFTTAMIAVWIMIKYALEMRLDDAADSTLVVVSNSPAPKGVDARCLISGRRPEQLYDQWVGVNRESGVPTCDTATLEQYVKAGKRMDALKSEFMRDLNPGFVRAVQNAAKIGNVDQFLRTIEDELAKRAGEVLYGSTQEKVAERYEKFVQAASAFAKLRERYGHMYTDETDQERLMCEVLQYAYKDSQLCYKIATMNGGVMPTRRLEVWVDRAFREMNATKSVEDGALNTIRAAATNSYNFESEVTPSCALALLALDPYFNGRPDPEIAAAHLAFVNMCHVSPVARVAKFLKNALMHYETSNPYYGIIKETYEHDMAMLEAKRYERTLDEMSDTVKQFVEHIRSNNLDAAITYADLLKNTKFLELIDTGISGQVVVATFGKSRDAGIGAGATPEQKLRFDAAEDARRESVIAQLEKAHMKFVVLKDSLRVVAIELMQHMELRVAAYGDDKLKNDEYSSKLSKVLAHLANAVAGVQDVSDSTFHERRIAAFLEFGTDSKVKRLYDVEIGFSGFSLAEKPYAYKKYATAICMNTLAAHATKSFVEQYANAVRYACSAYYEMASTRHGNMDSAKVMCRRLAMDFNVFTTTLENEMRAQDTAVVKYANDDKAVEAYNSDGGVSQTAKIAMRTAAGGIIAMMAMAFMEEYAAVPAASAVAALATAGGGVGVGGGGAAAAATASTTVASSAALSALTNVIMLNANKVIVVGTFGIATMLTAIADGDSLSGAASNVGSAARMLHENVYNAATGNTAKATQNKAADTIGYTIFGDMSASLQEYIRAAMEYLPPKLRFAAVGVGMLADWDTKNNAGRFKHAAKRLWGDFANAYPGGNPGIAGTAVSIYMLYWFHTAAPWTQPPVFTWLFEKTKEHTVYAFRKWSRVNVMMRKWKPVLDKINKLDQQFQPVAVSFSNQLHDAVRKNQYNVTYTIAGSAPNYSVSIVIGPRTVGTDYCIAPDWLGIKDEGESYNVFVKNPESAVLNNLRRGLLIKDGSPDTAITTRRVDEAELRNTCYKHINNDNAIYDFLDKYMKNLFAEAAPSMQTLTNPALIDTATVGTFNEPTQLLLMNVNTRYSQQLPWGGAVSRYGGRNANREISGDYILPP